MPHVLVAGKLHPAGLAVLESAARDGFTFDYVQEVSEPAYAPLIAAADALVIRTQPLSAATVAKAGRLKVVSRHGVGYDSVDVAALNARAIALTVVGDVNSVSVAEHAMMQILASAEARFARPIVLSAAVAGAGAIGWKPREITGKNLLVVGFGRAGRHLARMAAGFQMQVRAYDPFLREKGWPRGVRCPRQT